MGNISKKVTALLTAGVLVFLMIAGLPAGAQQFPSLQADTAAFDYGQRIAKNRYWRDLAEASLWLSAVNSGQGAAEKAAAYMGRIDSAAAELKAAADLPNDAAAKGEYVLTFLHKRFFKSYSEHQTRIDELIASGKYNCVSSAVMYVVFGLSVGLDVSGVITKDHAFCRVFTGTDYIDVETTNPHGFDPGNKKEFENSFGRTGFVYVPAANYRDRMTIDGIQLASMILHNRIAVLERQNRFAEVVPLAINRAAFLSGGSVQTGGDEKNSLFEDPRQNLIKHLLNLGAQYIKTGKEDDAIAWAEYAGKQFPDPGWQEVIDTAANNKLVRLVRSKKIPEARSALTALQPVLGGESFLELETMILEAELTNLINTVKEPDDAEAALALLARIEWRLPPQRVHEMRTTAILAGAKYFERGRDWIGGMQWLEEAIKKYGANVHLETNLRTLRQNRINELHNEFAVLYNKKNYEQAKVSIQRSLEEFPGDRQLIKDLELVEKSFQR